MPKTSTQSSTATQSGFKKTLVRSLYVCGATLLLVSASAPSGVALADTINQPQVTRQARAGLADVSLLTNSQLVTNKANPQTPNNGGNYDLDLTYTGAGVANVGLATRKVMVFALAQELQGKVQGAASVNVSAALTDINLSGIPGVTEEVAIVQAALSLLGTGTPALQAVQNSLNRLTSAQPLGTYNATVAGNVSNDRITADITDGLGNYVNQQAGLIIADVQHALDGLPNNITTSVLRGALNTLIGILNPIITGSSALLNNLLDVNLLGHTSANLKTTVSQPTAANTHVYGILSNNAAVDLDLLASDGDSVPLTFDIAAENPLENYTVNAPTVNTATAGDTSISGNVAIAEPVPDGTTFKAIATMPGGGTKEGTVTVNGGTGTFTIDTGTLNANDVLSVKVEAANGTNTKASSPTSVTVQPGQATNPIENYNVATPTLSPAKAGDTSVSGTATLNAPIPAGTTFKAIASLPGGGEQTSDVTVNGTSASFTVDTGALEEGQQVSVKLQAVNGDNTKDGSPATVTVDAADPTNPLDGYTVNAPSVDPAKDGQTAITGNANLNTPFPDGTTFKAIATLPGSIDKEAIVNPDGTYSIDSGTLTAGQDISVKIQAANGTNTKDSTPTGITVGEADPTNPIADYDVATPVLTTPKNGDTTVTGSATLATPVPAGTTFKAIATLPGGVTKTVDANVTGSNATFSIDTDALNTGEVVSVKLQAVNGDNTKDGSPATATVEAVIPDNPLDGYTVNAPSVNPAKDGQTAITGNANLNTPFPDGTTFKAIATLPGGIDKEATVNPDGTYSIDTGSLIAGEDVSVKIQAANGDNTKDSTPTDITIGEADPTNPIADYDVATPMLTTPKNGDTTVTGSAMLNTPVPAGTTFKAIATLPGGVTKTVDANVTGNNATFTIDADALNTGEIVSVKLQAVNGDNTKDGSPATATVEAVNPDNPLDGYTVNAPSVNPATAGETTVTGNANFNMPTPDGTTFTAIATLPGGIEKVATVNGDGSYSIDTGTLIAGEDINVKIKATNGSNTKDSLPTGIIVNEADPTDPLDGYTVNVPSVDPAVDGDTTIDGNANLNTPFPDGTTFKAIATLPGGVTKEATVNPDGSFSIDSGLLTAMDEISVKIEATNGNKVKDSLPVSFFVGRSDPTEENPLTNYNVATPTLQPAKNGDTIVSGTATLSTPVPEGTTFKAIATLPDGSTKTVDATVADGQASFTVDTGALTTGQVVSVKLQAVNGDNTKDGSPASVTVEAGDPTNPTNPLDGYNVGTPTVNPAKGGDTSITGNANLTPDAPAGTTFTAVATLPDGSTKTGTVNPDGTFTIDSGTLTAGQIVNVKIQATNGDNTKDSSPVDITVGQPNVSNPLDNYNVGTPTVDPVNVGDTSVTGNANITMPIPDGTTFTAVVTLPDGSTKTGTVDANGHFSVPIDGLTDGQSLSVKIVATNGENTKDSSPVNVTVGNGQPGTPSTPGNSGGSGSGTTTPGNGSGTGTGSGSTGTGTGATGTGQTGAGNTTAAAAGNGTGTGSGNRAGGTQSSSTGTGQATNRSGRSTGTGDGSASTGTGSTGDRRSVTSGSKNQTRAISSDLGNNAGTTQSGSQKANQTSREKSGVLPLTDQQRTAVLSILGAGLLIGAAALGFRLFKRR